MSKWRHIPALDGLRGIAVSAVMIHHLFLTEIFGGPEWLGRLAHSGWMGVDLFFVLSGYLITGILIEAKDTRDRFRNFYMRRFLRIFPLYYGVLATVLLVAPAILSSLARTPASLNPVLTSIDTVRQQQVYLWLYLQNFGDNWYMFNHFWSLAVEEHFYLLWPALIFFLSPKRAQQACVVIVALAIASRIVWLSIDMPFGNPYEFTLCRMDALAIGGLTALLAREKGSQWISALGKKVVLTTGVPLAVALVVWGGFDRHRIELESVGFTIIALFFAGVVAASLPVSEERSLWQKLMQNGVLRSLGKYSYGAYVFHRLLMRPMLAVLSPARLSRWLGPHPVLQTAVYFAGAAGATILAAFLSWHIYERHFLALKKRFSYEPTPEKAIA